MSSILPEDKERQVSLSILDNTSINGAECQPDKTYIELYEEMEQNPDLKEVELQEDLYSLVLYEIEVRRAKNESKNGKVIP